MRKYNIYYLATLADVPIVRTSPPFLRGVGGGGVRGGLEGLT